ncbi:hypothetical protein SADUNF_Sadunf01G0037500 [Salix dunnii]|uniref:Uncharacterized protein n=1 Tax=Salix dunnii TaxID=1413687 RepID=A0A835NA49_9ROSI|nr:hypothetical protein SADUNF_Sadunf01G0037500 [Salix dunnii]
MDIDSLWITGGRFIITDFNFMAPARKSPLCENTAKFQARVFFLSLLLIVPLLARPIDLSRKSTASSPSTGAKHSATEMHPHESKNAPPSSTATAAAAAADMTSTATTTKVPATPAASASDQLFKAAAHEVPSGPNPESN